MAHFHPHSTVSPATIRAENQPLSLQYSPLPQVVADVCDGANVGVSRVDVEEAGFALVGRPVTDALLGNRNPVAVQAGVGVTALMIGPVTPPLGLILFVLEKVTDLELGDVIRGMLPFYVPLLAALAILILVPELVLFLPRLFGVG